MPSAKIGDVVMFTSHLAEPREPEPPHWAQPSGPFAPPPPPKYRVLPAVVVGISGDQTVVDLQVFHRSAQGVQFARSVPYNSDTQTPNTWRSRP